MRRPQLFFLIKMCFLQGNVHFDNEMDSIFKSVLRMSCEFMTCAFEQPLDSNYWAAFVLQALRHKTGTGMSHQS